MQASARTLALSNKRVYVENCKSNSLHMVRQSVGSSQHNMVSNVSFALRLFSLCVPLLEKIFMYARNAFKMVEMSLFAI